VCFSLWYLVLFVRIVFSPAVRGGLTGVFQHLEGFVMMYMNDVMVVMVVFF
jgi:hypothetical protein